MEKDLEKAEALGGAGQCGEWRAETAPKEHLFALDHDFSTTTAPQTQHGLGTGAWRGQSGRAPAT
jgi:hypothetical protein